MQTALEIRTVELEDQQRIKSAALAILEQGEELLTNVSLKAFREKFPQANNASIGGHYRHCLDHFISLLRGLERDEIDYDKRDRDPHVENHPRIALDLTRRIRKELAAIPPEKLKYPIAARGEVSYVAGAPPTAYSSMGRELAYATTHAIHHYALISMMARMMGMHLPDRFGIAPSTVVHQSRQTR